MLPLLSLAKSSWRREKAINFKLLVLPAVKHLPAQQFDALDKYVSEGGHIVLLPESLVSDEYNRPADYLERWGIHIEHTDAPEVRGFGELEQKYDQNLERSVKFTGGREVKAAQFAPGFEPLALKTAGLFQQIDAPNGRSWRPERMGSLC